MPLKIIDGNFFLNYFLPEKLLEHFDITNVEELGCVSTKKMVLHIHLEEINTIPSSYDSSQYESKGFYPAKTIQDFSVRGKAVYLVIKRRRWRHKDEIIYNDYLAKTILVFLFVPPAKAGGNL